MAKKSKREELMDVVRNLNTISKQISSVTEDVGVLAAKASNNNIRVGDAGTDLSIKKVIEDEEKRTVTIIWEDGKVTKSKTDPKDEFDFNVGFGLCIAKKFVNNLGKYADAIKKSKTRYKKIVRGDKSGD